VPAEPKEIATNPIHLNSLPNLFNSEGLEVDDSRELLEQLGVDNLSQLVPVLTPDPGAVQNAPDGVIQDPAGTAIGAGDQGLRDAGGASRQIYDKFPDLKPIPTIHVKSAIFNSTTGPGRRVLHTYSPPFYPPPRRDPTLSKDRQQALEDLANAYANAIEAFRDRADALGKDGTLLNLVPVSAVLFAGSFQDPKYNHLHPSYTICAIVLALDWSRRSGFAPLSVKIHFHIPGSDDNPVYEAAKGVMKSLSGTS
jgi:hypothetical protein